MKNVRLKAFKFFAEIFSRNRDLFALTVSFNFGQRPFVFDLTPMASFLSSRKSQIPVGTSGYNGQVLAFNLIILLRRLLRHPNWRLAFEKQFLNSASQLTPYLNATLAGPSPAPRFSISLSYSS